MREFNINAEADPSGLRTRLKARFKVSDLQIEAVLGRVDKPAEACMFFRFGEMSNKPMGHVIEKYKAEKGEG